MDINNVIAYSYCGVALICCFIMFYNTHTVKLITPKHTITRNVYYAYLFAALSGLFDCAYILRENHVIEFSSFANYSLTLIYVLCSTLVGLFWVCYSELKQNSIFVKTKKRFYLYCLPLILSLLAILSTPFTKCYFYFEDGHYQRGSLFIPISLLLMVYIVQTGVNAFIKMFNKKYYTDRREYRRLFFFAVVYTSIQFIQIALPDIFPYRSVGLMLVFYIFLVQRLKEAIGKDALTHISNRYAAERHLDEVFKSRSNFEVAILDCDNFKSINDTYGHQEGDKALKYLSSSLKQLSNTSIFISRFGGDEFLIVNTDMNNSIFNIEDIINKNLNDILEKNNCEYRFTVSLGCIQKNESIVSIPDIISLADSKMYERKNSKKGKK